MRRVVTICVWAAVLLVGNVASAEFYAASNEIGYQGTIWNITDGTGPWTTSTPRDGVFYWENYGGVNYNQLLSNWFEHSPSNQNNSFLQLSDEGRGTVTSATGGWDASRKVFTFTVTGQNATYANSWARFWQPDNGVAWGVTFTDYTYTFAAEFASPAVVDSGWYVNSDPHPLSLTGSFTGEFVVTYDVNKNPILNGDTYGFNISFSDDLFSRLTASGATTYSEFGAPVPVPAAALLGLLGLSVAGARLRRYV